MKNCDCDKMIKPICENILIRIGNGYSYTYYPNNTFTERIFDENGLLSINHKRIEPATPANPNGAETVLESFTYTYNNTTGNITRITTANGEYTDYTYDLLDRLTCEEKKTQAGQWIYKIEYLFDNNDAKNGNIHQVVLNDESVTTFTNNPMNQLTQITNTDTTTETLTYDDNGNLTQSVNNTTGEVTTYTWDCFNRMTGISNSGNGATTGETVGFTYDGEHKLTQIADSDQTVDLRQTGIDTITRIARIRQSNSTEKTIVSHNIIGNGQILSKYGEKGTESQICLHYDHNSNLAIITDAHGRIVEKPLMDAYGNILPHETAIPGTPAGSPQNQPAKTLQPTLLTGGAGVIYLHKARMYNMRRRFYNSLTARFASNDVISSANRYEYAAGNPIKLSDPSGMLEIVSDSLSGTNHGNFEDFAGADAVRTAVRIAIEKVNTLLSAENTPCAKAFKCYCPNQKVSVTKILENTIVDFCGTNYEKGIRFGGNDCLSNALLFYAHKNWFSNKNYIHTSFLGIAFDLDVLAASIIHELAHSSECGIGIEKRAHPCCDVIAVECGFPIIANGGMQYINKVKGYFKSYINNNNPLNYIVAETARVWSKYPESFNPLTYTDYTPYLIWNQIRQYPAQMSFDQYWKMQYSVVQQNCKQR